MPGDPRLLTKDYEPGPAKVMLPKEGGVERVIEPHKTYRVPRAGKTVLLRVQKVGSDTLTVKDMQTGKVSTISKSGFQAKLNRGEIYVSADLHPLTNVLKKLVDKT